MKHDLVKALKSIFETKNVGFAYLYGSCALAETHSKSDIDIAVYLYEKERKKRFAIRLGLLHDISVMLQRNDVDLVVINDLHNSILKDSIIREGMCIYCANKDIKDEVVALIRVQYMDFRDIGILTGMFKAEYFEELKGGY